MTTMKTGFLGSGMSYAELVESVEFSPNEPGIPFGDNLAHQVSCICRQFGDNKTPALSAIRLLPVTNSDLVEVMEKGGSLIEIGARNA